MRHVSDVNMRPGIELKVTQRLSRPAGGLKEKAAEEGGVERQLGNTSLKCSAKVYLQVWEEGAEERRWTARHFLGET